MQTIDYSNLPEHMQDGVRDYIENGYSPGGFLYAVLTNDLMGAFAHADRYNRPLLSVWAQWLYNEAPASCWGSPEKVAAWMAAIETARDAAVPA